MKEPENVTPLKTPAGESEAFVYKGFAFLDYEPVVGDRVDELARKYEAAHADPENARRCEEVHDQLSGLLGEKRLNLLREYTDRLIARVNPDLSWFYYKGVEDAVRFFLRHGGAGCTPGGKG